MQQEIAGNLDDILPVGFSIDVEGIGVLGHSRGGNIAALQLNATSIMSHVLGGYLIDPVGCGTRFAACGGVDGNAGAYRAGWTAISQSNRTIMMSAAPELSAFNNEECTCNIENLDPATQKCPILFNVHCSKVVQNEVFFDASSVGSTRI